MEQIIIAAIGTLGTVVAGIIGLMVRQARKGHPMGQEERDLLMGLRADVGTIKGDVGEIKADLQEERRERREELQEERERRRDLERRFNEHVVRHP